MDITYRCNLSLVCPLFSLQQPFELTNIRVTTGEVNGPICHRAGCVQKTTNDYVVQIEYLDANGIQRTISEPKHLIAAARRFSLLGIVTYMSFKLGPMSYAVPASSKLDICLAIPPLSPRDFPISLYKSWTANQYATAPANFESQAENSYYAEWFFSHQQTSLVNTWDAVSDPTGNVDYPEPKNIFI